MKKISLSEFVENPDNPSAAGEKEFSRLVEKIKANPSGLAAMRIAYVTDDMRFKGKKMVISGNKRLRALKVIYGEKGKIPPEWTQDCSQMSEDQRRVFILAANVVEGNFDNQLLKEMYTDDELDMMLGAEAIDKIEKVAEGALSTPDAGGSDLVCFEISLSSDDYRCARLFLQAINEDINKALMEVVNERT